MSTRRLAALACAALSIAVAAPATAPAADGPLAHAACQRATIGGQSKCIARGQFCAIRFQRDYQRYGFTCAPKSGGYHLR
jgi:uncharacterized membrane protein